MNSNFDFEIAGMLDILSLCRNKFQIRVCFLAAQALDVFCAMQLVPAPNSKQEKLEVHQHHLGSDNVVIKPGFNFFDVVIF